MAETVTWFVMRFLPTVSVPVSSPSGVPSVSAPLASIRPAVTVVESIT